MYGVMHICAVPSPKYQKIMDGQSLIMNIYTIGLMVPKAHLLKKYLLIYNSAICELFHLITDADLLMSCYRWLRFIRWIRWKYLSFYFVPSKITNLVGHCNKTYLFCRTLCYLDEKYIKPFTYYLCPTVTI